MVNTCLTINLYYLYRVTLINLTDAGFLSALPDIGVINTHYFATADEYRQGPETRKRGGGRGWVQRGRERPVAHTRQGVILIRGAHSLITGFSLRSTGVRPDPNPH